jgi:hypothetical protein
MIDKIAYILLLFPLTLQLLFLHQLLPHPTYISIIITFASLVLLLRNRFDYDLNKIIIGFLFLLYCSLTLIMGVVPYIIGFIIINFFLIFIVVAKKHNIIYFIKYYIIFVVGVSSCGILSWILVHANLIDYNSWKFSLFAATDGKIMKEWYFVNPYGLGLVFDQIWYFFGLPYHRASGWSHEPHVASLFSNPALVYLLFGFKTETLFTKKLYYQLSIIIMTAFMIVTNSVAAQISLILIFIFYSIVNKKSFLLMLILLTLIIALLNLSAFSIITEKFSANSHSLQVAREFSALPLFNTLFMMSLHSILYFYNRNPASLVCLYILVHMLKGGGSGEILITPLYFFFLLVSLNSIRLKKYILFPNKI